MAAPTNWEAIMEKLRSPKCEGETLPTFLQHARWFRSKAHPLHRVRVVQAIALGVAQTGNDAGCLAFVEATYADIAPEIYVLPLQWASADETKSLASSSIIARLDDDAGEGVVFDALNDESFRSMILEIILGEKCVRSGNGKLVGMAAATFREQVAQLKIPLPSRALSVEQSNSAIIYDGRFFLKLYRKPEAGENPDEEMLRFLSERQKFKHVPGWCGAIEHRMAGEEPRVLALLVANVENEGDAWNSMLDSLDEFFARVQSSRPDPAFSELAFIDELIGKEFLGRVGQLGVRTAEMHLALAADFDDPSFTPEPFTMEYQRFLYESMRVGTQRMKQLLEQKLDTIPEKHRAEATDLISREGEILKRQAALLDRHIVATRTRCHGDYHLGQVLVTGDDFLIIDFEGEPARTLDERRAKASPLRDVAGMLRSFHYAAHAALARQTALSANDRSALEPWGDIWAGSATRVFREAYLTAARGASFIPTEVETLAMLFQLYLLEKVAYEICYELNNRPDWIAIPLRGIMRILVGNKWT